MLDPRELLATSPKPENEADLPLVGTRRENVQRLQIGLFGILSMVLLIALADIVISRADQAEATSVPEAAPTVAQPESSETRDPLADAGVVPELPAEAGSTEEGPQTGDVPAPVKQNAPLQ